MCCKVVLYYDKFTFYYFHYVVLYYRGIDMRNYLKNMNYLLLIFYTILGIVLILSASSVAAVLRYEVPSNYFAIRQIKYYICAYFLSIIVIAIPTSKYKYIYRLFLYGMIGLLILVLFVGSISNGAQAWLAMGGKRLQPLEFAKLALIIYLSIYYYKFTNRSYKNKWIFAFFALYPMILSIIIFVLLAKQPDLGGAIIIAFIAAFIFFSIPMPKKNKKLVYRIVILFLIIGALGAFLLKDKIFDSYQLNRLNFMNPCSRYKEDSGYQVCNSYIAIHNGGLRGVGLGNSTQKYMYLPEAHTDFIFAILVEELGLIFGVFIVIGYFVMLFAILKIAKKATNLRNSILAYGVFTYIFAHIAINLMGILGIIPLTGVPLPFLSYGGSYGICVVLSMAIIQKINIENKNEEKRNKIKNLH